MKKSLLLTVCLMGSLSVSASQSQEGPNRNIHGLYFLMAAQSGLPIKAFKVDSAENKAILSQNIIDRDDKLAVECEFKNNFKN